MSSRIIILTYVRLYVRQFHRKRFIPAGILAVERISRSGSIGTALTDGARFAVAPYMGYRSPKDLAIFDRCATSRSIPVERYAACFACHWGEAIMPTRDRSDAAACPMMRSRPKIAQHLNERAGDLHRRPAVREYCRILPAASPRPPRCQRPQQRQAAPLGSFNRRESIGCSRSPSHSLAQLSTPAC